jgi:glucokinase
LPIGDESGSRLIQAPMVVLCPGTGMGVAGLVPVERGWRSIASEGGHASLAPLTDREIAVWQFLRKRYGRVSWERVLSGPGIVELYQALASLEGRDIEAIDSKRIVQLALAAENGLAVETLEIYCAWLGDVAGDAALIYGAQGGVYLAGDILRAIFELLKGSQFRARFKNKGRVSAMVRHTPTLLVALESPVLHGCAYLLEDSAHLG